MKAAPNIVSNAVVYLNGRNLLGRADEVTPPAIKDVLQEHKPLGLMSAVKLATGTIEAMEAKYKWGSVYRDVLETIADPEESVQLMVRAEVKTFTGRGLSKTETLVMSIHGPITDTGMGSLKQGEQVKPESTQQVWYYKLEIGGNLIYEVDVFANVRKKGSRDVLESFRNLIGG
ncbi:MAG TPA: phage major tail tube protein [Longimicrobium sp.]|jgi:hypothetical protein